MPSRPWRKTLKARDSAGFCKPYELRRVLFFKFWEIDKGGAASSKAAKQQSSKAAKQSSPSHSLPSVPLPHKCTEILTPTSGSNTLLEHILFPSFPSSNTFPPHPPSDQILNTLPNYQDRAESPSRIPNLYDHFSKMPG